MLQWVKQQIQQDQHASQRVMEPVILVLQAMIHAAMIVDVYIFDMMTTFGCE